MRDDGSILPVSYGFLFSPFFFPSFFHSFFHLQFSYPSFFPLFPPYPLPLPTPEDFFPTPKLNLWIFHGSLPESTWKNQSLKIMMVVEGGGGGGGGGDIRDIQFWETFTFY